MVAAMAAVVVGWVVLSTAAMVAFMVVFVPLVLGGRLARALKIGRFCRE